MGTTTNQGGPVTDAGVAAALRPFVRATRPLLRVLSDADPLGLQARARRVGSGPAARKWSGRLLDRLAETRLPGTAAWAGMDEHERSQWWVRRVGRVTSLVAAVPAFGGVITRRMPVTGALGAAAQGLVLCAIAEEHDLHEAEVVALLGAVLFGRDLAPTSRAELSETTNAEVDARAAELTGDLNLEREATPKRIAGAVWRLGRALLAADDELDKRPQGGLISRWTSMLPVVGVAGKYVGEWSGLQKAARAGEEWIHARHG
jgi:hypothetical protein